MDAPEIRLRESPRVELAGEARLFFGAAGPPIAARLIDLSTTGMGLAGPTGFAPGQTCAFELAVDGVAVAGRGVVVWTRRPRQDRGDAANLGARFTDFEGAGAAAISSLVERRLAETRRPVQRARPPAALDLPLQTEQIVPSAVEVAEAAAPARPGGEPAPPTEPADARRSPVRFLPWLAVIAGVAIVVGLIAGSGEDESEQPAIPSSSEPTAPPPGPATAVPATAVPATAVPEPTVVPATVEAVEAEAPPPAAIPRAAGVRKILSIEAGRGDGDEILVLQGDGPFRREDVSATLMGVDPPRFLLRLSGIELPLSPPTLEVGAPLIQRVRTGLHTTPKGPELHVVLDLASRAVEPAWEIEGDVLRVRLRPRSP